MITDTYKAAAETLMGMEAVTADEFADVCAGRTDLSFCTLRTVALAGAVRVSVWYNVESKWAYEIHAGEFRGLFDHRAACLDSIAAHWPVGE
jgi:hypothetical protein